MAVPLFDILYEEGPCLAVSKPPGLLTQAPPGVDSLEARIKDFLKHRDHKPGSVYLGVPHRLDRPASGAMVFGKHARAARRLSEQFQGRLVRKTYWALVAGEVAPSEDEWRDYVRKVPDEPRAEIVSQDHVEGRLAVLRYRVLVARRLPEIGAVAWLEIELETGRTHQVRIQAASRDWPVLGDAQYGSPFEFGPSHSDHRLRTIALHARRLMFRHPMTQEMITVTAPPPAAWEIAGPPPEEEEDAAP